MSKHLRLLHRAKGLLERKGPYRTGFLIMLVVVTLAADVLAVRQIARAIATGRYNDLVSQYAGLTTENHDLAQQFDALSQTQNSVLATHNTLGSDYDALLAEHETLIEQNTSLQRSYDALVVERDRLSTEFAALAARYRELSAKQKALQAAYDSVVAEYDWVQANALTPPYISVKGREVSIVFLRSDGSTERWQVPFDSLESSLQAGMTKRQGTFWQRAPRLTLTDPVTDQDYAVVDYRAYIDPGPFETVVGTLYKEMADDYDFIYETWFIVTQLVQYSSEIRDTPRYPLETFLEGGGDCEDTAILLASMIKAAPVDWELDLVYMDADHPEEPEGLNHLIVSVDTGTQVYLIETTNDTEMLPYENVQGWYLPIE